MCIKDVKILCGDLNARMVMFFIQKTGEFKSSVWIEKDEYRVNAKYTIFTIEKNKFLIYNSNNKENENT